MAVADSYTAVAGSPLTVAAPGVLSNDTDADSNTLTAALVTNPANGTLTLNPNGSFTYTPNSGFNGSDSFTYRANDGTDNSSAATVSISVQSITPGTVVNGSFEDDETGWTMSGNRIVTSSSAPYTATNGSKLMVFNGAQTTPDAEIYQTIVTVPGQTYAVEFDMGIVGASGSQQRLQLLVTGNTTLVNTTETIVGIGVNNARWLPKSFSFVADSTTTRISFNDLSNSTQSIDLLLDNVRVITGTSRSLIFNTTSTTPVAVTVSPADLGGATGGTTTFTRSYNVGTVLSISAPAVSGTGSFLSWERNGTQFSTNASTTVTVNGNEYITAVYSNTGGGSGGGETGNTRTLTINSTPAAGSAITVSPADNTGATNGTTNFTRTYPTGTEVSLVAPHQNFVKWLRNGLWYATNPSITVTADSSHTMTAVYTETPVLGPFTNGSFEDEFRGWTWTGGQQSVKIKDGLTATAGLLVIEFNSNSSANGGAISQTFTTSPGTVYTVAFDQGVLAFNSGTQVIRARVDNSSGTALFNQTYSLRGNSVGTPVWQGRSFTFTANSATSKITFTDASTTGNGLDLLLDNVRITPPGPGGTIVTRTLTVNSSGVSAVPVTVTPTDNASQGNGTTQFTRTYNEGTSVSLTAPATSGTGTFSKWQRNGTDISTNRTVSVAMDANYTLTAIYTVPSSGSALTNPSFESGLSGWTVGGTAGAVDTDSALATTNGSTLAKFNSNNTPNDGTLSQTFTTINGATYSVTFDQGVLSFNTQSQIIQALLTNASGSVLASQNFTLRGVSNGNINWATRSLSFVANSTSTTLTFRDISTTGAGLDMLLDHIRLVKTADPGTGPNVIVNGSFEQSPDYFGWTPTFSTRIEKPGPFYATNGNNILSFNVGGEPVGGSISQTFPTVADTTYKIAYDVGVLGYFAKVQRLNMKIMNGTTTLLNQTTSVTGRADFVMVWVPVEFTFVAQSAATTLVFTDTSTDGGGLDLFVDFVRVNSIASSAPAPALAPMASAAFDPALLTGESVESGATTPDMIPDTPVISGTAGAMRIGMNASEPGRYFLERSANLLNWNFHSEQSITEPGYIEFEDNSPAEARMFYRIGRNPADTGN